MMYVAPCLLSVWGYLSFKTSSYKRVHLCSALCSKKWVLVVFSPLQCSSLGSAVLHRRSVQRGDDLSRQLLGRFSQLETIYLIHWVGSILQYYLSIILQFSPIHPNHHHSSVKFIQLCSSKAAAGHFLHCS